MHSSSPPTQQISSEDRSENLVDLASLFNTIWRGKWIILALSMIAAIAGGYYALRIPTPLYVSSTVVVLDTKLSQFTDLENVVGGLTGDTEEVNTEVEILKSRRLLGKVVDRLELGTDPEFNEQLKPSSSIDLAIDKVKETLGLSSPAPTQTPEIAARILRDQVITRLLESISIRNIPNSLVFQLSVKTEAPLKSANIADTLAELYILDQINVKYEETERVTKWLTERVTQFRSELETAEAAVSDYNASIDLVSVQVLSAQEVQLKELRDRIERTQIALSAEQATLSGAANDDAQLLASISRHEHQLSILKASEEQITLQIERQSGDLIQLQQLSREAEALRLLYEYFLGRLKETRAQQGTQQADSRVLSPAVIPSQPASPNKPVLTIMTTVLGMLFGVALVLLRESRQTGLRSARDLEKKFGYSVLGQIPMVTGQRRTQILSHLARNDASAINESFRQLRTSIMMSDLGTAPQVIINTSCVAGEGKTTTSIGLAMQLTGLGKKILLMDGDLRRQTLAVYFPEIKKRKRITDVILGNAAIDEATCYDEESKLWCLGGSNSDVNAADLLSSHRYESLLQDLRAQFDYIVIDCPPVLAVPDAGILARYADVVLFTIKWDSTSQYQVEEALRNLHTVGQKITGFILSKIDMRRIQSYGQYGQYAAYGEYGKGYHSE